MEANEITQIVCPYCAQELGVEIDHTAGDEQEWVTDCEVCCRAIVVRVHCPNEEVINLDVLAEQD